MHNSFNDIVMTFVVLYVYLGFKVQFDGFEPFQVQVGPRRGEN